MYRYKFNFNNLSYDQKHGWVVDFLDSISKEQTEENIDAVINLIETFDNFYYWESDENANQ